MDELKQIGEMIYSNVQWIFSGIGVAVISILGGKAAVKKVKRKQKAKNQGVNISSDKDINSENILTQTAGENSKNLNVMEYAHLQYLGCTGILSEGSTYKPIEEIFRNRYAGLFSRGFSREEFYEYMGIEIQEFQQLITTCQIDKEKYQFNAMNENVLKYSIAQSGKQEYEEKLLQYYKEHIMEVKEIKDDISSHVQGFEELADFWKKTSEFKSMNLTSVGIEIGLLNYNLQTGSKIQWKDFI